VESEALMPELNEDNFELIDRNKDISLQRDKLKYLQDRIETLEKSVAQLNEIIGELKNERL
jgi:cell division protein FtsB